ncbi:MAG: tetratricopeptide repeat protein, partial [Hyphomicrobium sp.]
IVQAQTFRRAGDFDGATRTLSQLVLVAPDDPRVLGEYGKTLVAKGQTEDAIAFLNRAIELNPREWTFYSAQGVAFDQARNFRAANMAYQRALALQPGEPSVLSNAGLSRMQAGDLANAEILLSRAIERGGANPRISRNLAMVRDLAAAKAATQAPSTPEPAAPDAVANAPSQENVAAPLPGAVERREIPAPTLRTSSAVQALAADPKVFMQRIPEPDPVPEAITAPVASLASDQETGAEIEKPENKRTASAAPRPLTERLAVDATRSDGLRRLVPVE